MQRHNRTPKEILRDAGVVDEWADAARLQSQLRSDAVRRERDQPVARDPERPRERSVADPVGAPERSKGDPPVCGERQRLHVFLGRERQGDQDLGDGRHPHVLVDDERDVGVTQDLLRRASH